MNGLLSPNEHLGILWPEHLSFPQVQNLQGQLRQTGQGLYGQAQGMAQGLQGQLMQQGQGLYGQAQSMGGGLQNQLMQQGQGLYGQAQSMGQGAFQQGMNLGNQFQQQGQNAFRQGAGMAQGFQGSFFSKVKLSFKKACLVQEKSGRLKEADADECGR